MSRRWTDIEREKLLKHCESLMFRGYTAESVCQGLNRFIKKELDSGEEEARTRKLNLKSTRRLISLVRARYQAWGGKDVLEQERAQQIALLKRVQVNALEQSEQGEGGEAWVLKANERLSRLMGLDAPQKVEVGLDPDNALKEALALVLGSVRALLGDAAARHVAEHVAEQVEGHQHQRPRIVDANTA